jgi:hypothetical protein
VRFKNKKEIHEPKETKIGARRASTIEGFTNQQNVDLVPFSKGPGIAKYIK